MHAMGSRIEELQGASGDRPYFLKTLCGFAHVLRTTGWAALAIPRIEAAQQNGALDAYVLSELVECQLAVGDTAAAARTLQIARASRFDTAAIYTSLLTVHGRAGNWRVAEDLFATAIEDGISSEFVFTAMIAAYARGGQMAAAQATLDAAQRRGATSETCFTALITAFGRARRPGEAQRVFDQAQTCGMASTRAYTSLMRAYAAAGEFRSARRLLEEATARGTADDRMYSEFIAACLTARRLREAFAVFKRARAAGRHLGVTRGSLVARMRPRPSRPRSVPSRTQPVGATPAVHPSV